MSPSASRETSPSNQESIPSVHAWAASRELGRSVGSSGKDLSVRLRSFHAGNCIRRWKKENERLKQQTRKVLDSRMAVHEDVCLRSCHGESENGGVNWKELFLALRSTSQEEKKRKENSNAPKMVRKELDSIHVFLESSSNGLGNDQG